MAAGLLRHRLASVGLTEEFEVRSAGTWAVTGSPPASYASYVMAKWGIDISDHRSKDISATDVAGAELILVMTQAQREAILAEFQEAGPKTYLLSEMIGKNYDIADPYGSSLAHYEYCAEDLAYIIKAGFEQILRLGGGDSE